MKRCVMLLFLLLATVCIPIGTVVSKIKEANEKRKKK